MSELEASVSALLDHLDGRSLGPILAEKIDRVRRALSAPFWQEWQLQTRSMLYPWDCGHHHPTRGEAVACKRRQAGAFC